MLATMNDKAVSLLRELTEAHAVPGHEDEVRAIFVNELEDHGELSTDRMGSVFCEAHDEGPRVMVTAHMDEIGFLVQNITPDGFIKLVNVGGWWEHSLLAQRLEILTSSGKKIVGVVSSKPPHFLPESMRQHVVPLDQMFLDIGASSRRQAEEFGVALGDPVAPVATFTAMANPDLFIAKAFDNRVGMAALIQAGQSLAGAENRPNSLVLCGTVQEEVGLRGAKTAAVHARPDVAIVLEGPPADDTPGFPLSEAQGKLGGGVQIRMYDPSAIGNPRFARFAIAVAEESNIRHQVTVRRSGGTDAGSFHLANHGIPCLVLGVPSRYIHSHNALINLTDYLEMVKLVEALVLRLDESTVDGFSRCL